VHKEGTKAHRTFSFYPMDEAAAREVASWQYPEPYALYSMGLDDLEAEVAYFTDPVNHYYAISAPDGMLIAYRCFGQDAQVPGGDYSGDALDTGGGLRPDLTGQGFGLSVLLAGLDFGRRRYAPRAFRVTVAAFNERALKVVGRAGFQPVQRFLREPDGREFVVLIREPA
jgi:[ribosomal protein S18]-alanine N-acetyltransferase